MSVVEVVLDERDREKYGIPKPLLLDHVAFSDLPFSVSGAWEDELIAATGRGIVELMAGLLRDRAASKAAVVWLACRASEVPVPDFREFDIMWQRVKVVAPPKAKRKGADVNPPALGSSEPPSE